ncbi:uncharacterized protein dve isoform X2 [Bemisia tabaci]|uniref:uncharacterized protein dve isoform X2 n=1 Tax=Bemisia tabaci TaxID=7038 RepID=UPI003B283A08
MDYQNAMEIFSEAWMAANAKGTANFAENGLQCQTQALALTTGSKSPPPSPAPSHSPVSASPLPMPNVAKSDSFDDNSKNSPGKSLPVHCVVEIISSLQSWKTEGQVETDSYVIIPANTVFCDLVQVALHRLGYSRENAAAAKGSVVIKNWKPLSFDKISDNPQVTVGDILGELTTVATLKIQIFRSRPDVITEMKDKLLRLLLMQSHNHLILSGCPLDELVRSQCSSLALGEPSEEIRRKFDAWWYMQIPKPPKMPVFHQSPPTFEKPVDKTPDDRVHPVLQTVESQYRTQKTRMRTSFDPELELPKLQRWFIENQHPSRQQIQQYVMELNSLDSRRGRKPLDINNVVYWFKNARAAQKRAEVRNLSSGLHCHFPINGYHSNSQSPSDTGMMSKAATSPDSRDDDEESRLSSQSAPLSLTVKQERQERQERQDRSQSQRLHASSPHESARSRSRSRSRSPLKAGDISKTSPLTNLRGVYFPLV